MRTLRRKDFLRLSGAGLVSVVLPIATGCDRSNTKEVVRFFTGTKETAALERAVTAIQVDRFEEQHPNIDLQRKTLQPAECLVTQEPRREII